MAQDGGLQIGIRIRRQATADCPGCGVPIPMDDESIEDRGVDLNEGGEGVVISCPTCFRNLLLTAGAQGDPTGEPGILGLRITFNLVERGWQ